MRRCWGFAFFFCGGERIGVVFFHSLRLFPSDCCHCLHVSCRGKQTTLFILPIHVFQIGSPSLVVESLICRGASPSAPVDSSSSQPQRAPYPVPDFPVGVPEPNQPDIGTAQHVVSVSMRAVLAAWTLDSKASSRVCQPHQIASPRPDRGHPKPASHLISKPDADPTSQAAFASKTEARFAKPPSRNNSALASAANGPVMAGPAASVTRPPRPKPG